MDKKGLILTIDELEDLIIYVDEYVGHSALIMNKLKEQKIMLDESVFVNENWCSVYNRICKYVVPNGLPCIYPKRFEIDYTECRYYEKREDN